MDKIPLSPLLISLLNQHKERILSQPYSDHASRLVEIIDLLLETNAEVSE